MHQERPSPANNGTRIFLDIFTDEMGLLKVDQRMANFKSN
jgi:hypothetical protein